YVVGWTSSRPRTSRHPNGFPVTEGPDLTYNGGFDGDAFVAEVNAAGSGLVYAGYVGGSGDERGESIAVDPTGDAYITGHTDSSRLGTGKFTKGPDRTQDGISDAFVAKVHHTI
ncbi:MAG TPA: SBBP repeat-containing protein, partial [Acidimicrobiales bacterium]